MMESTENRFTAEQLREQWIYSSVVGQYESGRISTEAFGMAIVDESKVALDPARYCEEFRMRPSEKYPGVNELLQSLKVKMRIASLSNTNELHWDRAVNEMNFIHLFHFNFPSHQTGLLKPDPEAFANVVTQAGIKREAILFFDDNEVNVTGAKNAGIDAVKIDGIGELKVFLTASSIL
jgi:glucose-1-phosphatase